MRVGFVLPGMSPVPVGGYKVVYQYAEGLARDHGFVTEVWHLAGLRNQFPYGPAREVARRAKERRGSECEVNWFDTSCTDIRSVFRLNPRDLRGTTVLVATSWRTAALLAKARFRHFTRAYLVQGDETWSGSTAEVHGTWSLPMAKLVIARWLLERIRLETGHEPRYTPNGIDRSEFFSIVPPEARRGPVVGMLWHEAPGKGSAIGLEALRFAHDQLPELRAHIFSTYEQLENLPPWIRWHSRPSPQGLRNLYNQISVFLSPSLSEGWALPPAEAMSCGACLISSDIGGVSDYAKHRETALLVPPGDSRRMAESLIEALSDVQLRVQLASAGESLIASQFTLSAAQLNMAKVLAEIASEP